MKTALLLLGLALATTGCTIGNSAIPIDPPPLSDEQTLFQFRQDADIRDWKIAEDAAQSGRSLARLFINEAGNAIFAGDVSPENGGGSSSVGYDFDPIDVSSCRAVFIGLKGDGKRYQLRVQSDKKDGHAYACDFQTSGNWQAVEIPFSNMYAVAQGDHVDLPNYPGQKMTSLRILIGTNQPGAFQLEIDKIWLKQ